MKKHHMLFGAILGLGLASVTSTTVLAQAVVQQLDNDTLRVTQYKGKPPLKRTVVTRAANPELFAHYAEMIDYNPQPLFASTSRGGAPGKSLPRTARRVSADPQEVAEFARFEESQEPSTSTRMWRGAPGKSRPLSR